MKLSSGGYSRTQYTPFLLRNMAKAIAEILPRVLKETGADAVVVTGKSGISLAFATMMLRDFNLVVVRKRGENSHGNPIESYDGYHLGKYIVLDDFISSGTTVRNIISQIDEMAGFGIPEHVKPEYCGCIMYNSGVDSRKFLGKPLYGLSV